MIKIKALIFCQACDASVEVLADLEEERADAGCGCCDRGTGRYYIDAEIYTLPEGWTKHRSYSTDYFCPDHKQEER